MWLEIIQCVLLAVIAFGVFATATVPVPVIDPSDIAEAVADGIELAREREEEKAQREYDSQP